MTDAHAEAVRRHIALSIRRERTRLSLSYEQLARKAGSTVTPRTVRRIESNETCKLASVVPILRALGLELVVRPKE